MPDSRSSPRRVQIGDAVCDFDQLTVQVDGELTRLEPRLAGVLAVLVQRAGEVLGRDELLALAWEADASDEALTQAVSRLRKLLGDRKAIETIPRVGYRLTAVLTAAPAVASPPSAAPAEPAASETRPDGRWWKIALVAFAAAMLGAAASLWLFGGPRVIEREFEIQPREEEEIEFIPQSEASRDVFRE
jgi:DNA-binding winged helix-turn-helix (wHTH) protein